MASLGATLSASLALIAFSATFVVADQKTTQLHFYFHELNPPSTPSALRVAQANTTDASPTSFGAVVVADNLLTEGPELTSKLVGRAQGMYMSSSQEELSFSMALNYVFTAGAYNGSVLSMMGVNPLFHPVREISVVGGTGYFRFAQGYALLHTVSADQATGVVTVEYNVTVVHPY